MIFETFHFFKGFGIYNSILIIKNGLLKNDV